MVGGDGVGQNEFDAGGAFGLEFFNHGFHGFLGLVFDGGEFVLQRGDFGLEFFEGVGRDALRDRRDARPTHFFDLVGEGFDAGASTCAKGGVRPRLSRVSGR